MKCAHHWIRSAHAVTFHLLSMWVITIITHFSFISKTTRFYWSLLLFTGSFGYHLDMHLLRCPMQSWMKTYASVFSIMIVSVQMQYGQCFWLKALTWVTTCETVVFCVHTVNPADASFSFHCSSSHCFGCVLAVGFGLLLNACWIMYMY